MAKCEKIRSLLDLQVGEPERRDIKINRLGITFTVKALSYNKLMKASSGQDANLHYILESTVSPNLRDAQWYEDHMGCVTPVEALKKLLLAGEVNGIVKILDKLNGYGPGAVTDVTRMQQAAIEAAVDDLEKN